RSDWLGSYMLACRDEETGKLKTVGKMATGFTDEQLDEMTERLEPLIVEEEGRHVDLKPEVVVEVAYEEIQKSPKYESGYALRFPRLVQVREDMDPERANELEKVENLYDNQEGGQQ
ncbi:MAG: DNA ligase, partial [Candidatus Nanohaloarchaea archaeon]